VSTILEIHRHSCWANGQILDAAERLTAEQLRTPLGEGSFGDFLITLIHIYDAQRTWYERAKGGTSGPAKEPEDFPTIEMLRQAWRTLDTEMGAYLASLDEESLMAPVSYRSFYGSEGTYTRRDMMLHQAFHAHQHRAELALALSAMGHSPGELDFLDYREASG
jgi:uncharacterized damage-inducible protein DinB